MSTKKNYSNAFSRVLSKSKSEENKPMVINDPELGEIDLNDDAAVQERIDQLPTQQVNNSTSKQVNQKDLYEVNKNELNKFQEGEKLTSQPVKKLTKTPKEIRTVKGFKLTEKTQKIIGLMAQLQGKKEYEILEQGVDLLLEANPEMKQLLKMI